MLNINLLISEQLEIKLQQVENVIQLKSDGATIPFIARYRKEVTNNLDENYIRDIFDKYDYFTELEDRKLTILKSIEEQGKLTPELRKKIEDCILKNELEDLYLPYKPKRRTKATIAKEKGLEPLSILIKQYNVANADKLDLESESSKYINLELGVNNYQEALQGAADIIAEEVSENADLRKWFRSYLWEHSNITTKFKADLEEGSTKYENYRNFNKSLFDTPSHAYLAIRRAEKEGVLSFDFDFNEDEVLSFLNYKCILTSQDDLITLYHKLVKDSFNRLIKNSIIAEVRLEKKQSSDEQAISVFEQNLRQILLASPAGLKPTLGIDPGFRTGCKIVALDDTGKLLENFTIYPHSSQNEQNRAAHDILNALKKYNIELIAIGNGTAGRETYQFVNKLIENLHTKPILITVNESGASIYSASEIAQKEFPDYDLTVRGAVSIGRRLMDPLAELVKLDPKSIGVGQYQHDVDQKLLNKKLEETVSSCVNYVGVDINTASAKLLTYVAGISSTVANNIVEYRNTNGKFKNREELKKVAKFGDKTFEQSAGFLRIRNGNNPLDNTAVHPESYKFVNIIAEQLSTTTLNLISNKDILKTIDIKTLNDIGIGQFTLNDILLELEKPGRDPREEFKYAQFDDKISEIAHLKQGMELEGVVTNITNFGCFVDIGVHQDGLVHISEMADQFVKDPSKIVKVGQIVKVRVMDVNEKLKQIKLSMKKGIPQKIKNSEPNFSLTDLKDKFKK
ncbi:MAG TPA: Tex family protein [Candidatus Kapabacteria bacterium]|nr:Tex family protein [Candidatus Kapabacteria bacterium]